MTEDPSGPESDDEPADGNDGGETSGSARDAADAERDPFEETFIVKEAEETNSQAETEDESSTVGNSWLDESPIDEADSTGERISDERRNDRTPGSGDEHSDEDWGRIPIDLGREDDGAAETPSADAESVDEDDSHRPEPSSTPVVPGDPSLEGAVFVLFGAIAMILVMFRLASVMLA